MDFDDYVQSRSAALSRTAYLLTGDVHLAEDLLQDTLARVADRWRRVSRGGDPEPYVRRVMYHRAVDSWRRPRVREVSTDADHPELRAPGDPSEAVVRRVVLRDALSRLTTRQRAVLVLRFYEDLSERESAVILGCSVNTVKSQTRHALERLRTLAPELGDTFGPPSDATTPDAEEARR